MKVQQRVRKVWATLSDRRRQKLRRLAKHCTDGGLRCRVQIVLNLVQGRSAQLIHEVLHCSLAQVYRIAARFVDHGETGLADGRQDNGTSKITWEYEWWVQQAVAGSPQQYRYDRPTWTQELLIRVLRRKTGIRIGRATMSRLLRRLKIRRGRPKPIVGCPWKKQRRQRRLRQLRRLVRQAAPGEVVLYADEVDIHLNPKIGPDYMLPGTQKKVLTPGKNEKRYLAGALNADSGKMTWVEWSTKSSDLFILLLHALLRDYPTAQRIHLILDNYKIHKSQRTLLALAALNGRVQLHFLPPYCPDENRIERHWRDLHDNVTRNHQCRTMGELMSRVRAFLRRRNEKLQREAKVKRVA